MKLKINFDFTWPIIISVILVILKLFKVISWSWIWVTCPFWGAIIIFGVVVAVLKLKGWL